MQKKSKINYTCPSGQVYNVEYYYEGTKFIAGSLEREPYYPQLIIHSVTDMQGNEVDTDSEKLFNHIENLHK